MTRLKLPIGIQTFAKLREDGCYYVDKTAFVLRLIEQGTHYFLSRPRRFGKSLLLDTLAELFAGNQTLFQGLYAHDRWDWDIRYPVIRVSFGGGMVQDPDQLTRKIGEQLRINQATLGVTCREVDIESCFAELIREAHAATGRRVVVLVDEYDKPILDNLTRPETATAIRDGLRNLYSVIKDSDAHIRFAMLTGVSKFSKVSLFSGLNNLNDITVDAEYSAICGYTETDLDQVFAAELDGLDRDEIRRWYNGYNWTGESVYNPFDVLLLFQKREFRPWWFETGTPRFLLDLLTERQTWLPRLGQLETDAALLSAFEVGNISHRSPDVPDRLSHHRRGGTDQRHLVLSAALSQPRGLPEPQHRAVGSLDPPTANQREQSSIAVSVAVGQRFRRYGDAVRRAVRRHPE